MTVTYKAEGSGTQQAAALFRTAEMRAERTIGIVRILVSLMLAVSLLFAAIGAAPREMSVIDRQIALAGATLLAYLMLGVAAVVLAREGRFRPWMPWGFATLDVVFILVSVVLNLENLQSPGNIVSALPVIWLLPIALAFGALRYNPVLQGYVGTLAVGGVVSVVLIAVPWGNVDDRMVEALTLVHSGPPNLMRLTMLLVAGVILVIAAARARGLLIRAIDDARRRATLTRFLPAEIAAWLAGSGEAEVRRGRRQAAAVMFVDIRAFTHHAESLSPDALSRFIGEFRGWVTLAARTHGGVIDKFVGDGAMIVFGMPAPAPDDAQRALACADAMFDGLARWNADRATAGAIPVEIGIGLHFGEVFCGAIGDDARLEFTVLGDTVNVAARLQEETKTAGCPLIVSEALLKAAGEAELHAGWTALQTDHLRGRDAPIALFGREAIATAGSRV